MTIKLHRYYGDEDITKSVMEVFLEGDSEPRMVCEAREAAYKDYTESFPGASRYCLPVGRWPLKVGKSPYGPMGLRVPKCPGHRQVFIGWKWSRQCLEGEVLIGAPRPPKGEGCRDVWEMDDEEMKERRIENGEETFKRLDKLVYEAFGKEEEFILQIEPAHALGGG